jgi:hypothetical protein
MVNLRYFITGKDDAASDVDDLTEMMKNVSQLYNSKGTEFESA